MVLENQALVLLLTTDADFYFSLEVLHPCFAQRPHPHSSLFPRSHLTLPLPQGPTLAPLLPALAPLLSALTSPKALPPHRLFPRSPEAPGLHSLLSPNSSPATDQVWLMGAEHPLFLPWALQPQSAMESALMLLTMKKIVLMSPKGLILSFYSLKSDNWLEKPRWRGMKFKVIKQMTVQIYLYVQQLISRKQFRLLCKIFLRNGKLLTMHK